MQQIEIFYPFPKCYKFLGDMKLMSRWNGLLLMVESSSFVVVGLESGVKYEEK